MKWIYLLSEKATFRWEGRILFTTEAQRSQRSRSGVERREEAGQVAIAEGRPDPHRRQVKVTQEFGLLVFTTNTESAEV